MIQRVIQHLRGNAVAYVALFVALGGTSYAAVSLPRNSVGSKQLRNGAVTSSKLAEKQFRGRILAVTEINSGGLVVKSNPEKVTTSDWNANSGGLVTYPFKIPRSCFPVAAGAEPLVPTTGAIPQVVGTIDGLRSIEISDNGPAQMTVMLVCQN